MASVAGVHDFVKKVMKLHFQQDTRYINEILQKPPS